MQWQYHCHGSIDRSIALSYGVLLPPFCKVGTTSPMFARRHRCVSDPPSRRSKILKAYRLQHIHLQTGGKNHSLSRLFTNKNKVAERCKTPTLHHSPCPRKKNPTKNQQGDGHAPILARDFVEHMDVEHNRRNPSDPSKNQSQKQSQHKPTGDAFTGIKKLPS